MEINSEYDIIIVGGGPAGLTAAILAKRRGKSVIVLEKGPIFGPDPRGETLHYDPIIDEVLGEDIMRQIMLSETEFREYYPPLPTQDAMLELTRKTPSIVFDWRDWMDAFSSQIQALEISSMFNVEVFDVITEKNRVTGVKYKDFTGSVHEMRGTYVFVCDGHKSAISRKFNKWNSPMNFPIIKCIMKNGNHQTKAFKYFLVPAGALEYAPNFPPFIIFLFPRDQQNLETGIIIQADNANELGIPIPPISEIIAVWVKIKNNYPIFSEMVKRASIVYESITEIPMTGPISGITPAPNLVILGDAAGFIETSGGSGLISSMKMAKFWINEMDSVEDYSTRESQFKKTELYEHITKVAKRYNGFRRFLFVRLKSQTRIRKFWWLLKLILKLA